MKQLACEMCGSTDLMKQDGVFICQSCGVKYSVEEARKMMIEGSVDVTGSTVKIDNSANLENLLERANYYFGAFDLTRAEDYVNRVLDIDAGNIEAKELLQQITKMSSTAVPEKFTDKYINDEISKLNNSISNYESYIMSRQNDVQSAISNVNRILTENNQAMQRAFSTGADYRDSYEEKMYMNRLSDAYKERTTAEINIREYQKGKSDCENEKRELEALVQLAPIARLEKCYKNLIDTKNVSKDERILTELAKQFRELKGYRDSLAQAEECENTSLQLKYDRLVQLKNDSSKENEFKDLAVQFRVMNGYKNTNELADECESIYTSIKNEREEQERIEKQQRDEQARIEKEKREEQERYEKERLQKAEKKRLREEQERIAEEKEKKMMRICLEIAFWVSTLVYCIIITNIMNNISIEFESPNSVFDMVFVFILSSIPMIIVYCTKSLKFFITGIVWSFILIIGGSLGLRDDEGTNYWIAWGISTLLTCIFAFIMAKAKAKNY